MGRRVKPRFKMVLPVRVWGTDVRGKPFNLLGYTVDISAGGARLAGVTADLQVDDVIAVQYKQQKARFRVTWIGAPGSPKANQLGMEYLPGEKFIWIDLPSEDFLDSFTAPSTGRSSTPATEPATSTAASSSPTPSADVPGPAAKPPAAETEQSGGEDYLQPVADLLEKGVALLSQGQQLMEKAQVSEDAADLLHDAVRHTRNASWAVQQWLELQQDGKDLSSVVANVYSERVRFTSYLCQVLSEHVTEVRTGVSEENRQMLASALQRLGASLEVPALGSEARTNEADPVAALSNIDLQIRESHMPLERALRLITERVCSVIPASGAAIAFREASEMVCHASCGWAPDIGLRFHESDGLAGDAIAGRRVVVCADTENDSRVDPDLCKNVNLKSCVIVPICRGDQVIGVLEAFATEAHAFSLRAVSLLQQFADFISSLEPTLASIAGR